MTDGATHKLWGGRFAGGPSAILDAVNRSITVDFRLWPFDIRLSRAWAMGLWNGGVLTLDESERMDAGLVAVAEDFRNGAAPLPSDEDVHTMIDRLLDQGYASTDICSALISMLQGAAGGGPGGGGGNAPAAPAKPAVAPKPALAAVGVPSGTASAPAAPAPKATKAAPAWAKPVAYVKPKPAIAAGTVTPKMKDAGETPALPARTEAPAAAATRALPEAEAHDDAPPRKSKYERPARTGREPGMKTIFLNVGRKQLVTPADIVGKIAGVTRLPANVVGAMDIHQRHTLVDVAEAESEFIVRKLARIMLKGVALEPALAGPETAPPES